MSANTCPHCGIELSLSNYDFCPGCGQPLGGAQAPQPQTQPQVKFRNQPVRPNTPVQQKTSRIGGGRRFKAAVRGLLLFLLAGGVLLIVYTGMTFFTQGFTATELLAAVSAFFSTLAFLISFTTLLSVNKEP